MNKQKEHRREDILSVALNLFVKRGYGSTKVADIVSKANVSMGLLFHYFNTKEQLYHELIKIGCQSTELNLDFDQTPIKIFELSVKGIFDMISKDPSSAKMFVFMVNAMQNDSIPEESKELLSKIDVVERSIPVIRKGQQLEEIKQGDPLALSIAFWGSIQGIAQQIALNPDFPCPSPSWIIDILKINR